MPWAAPRNGYATIGGYVRNGLADMRLRPALGHLRAQGELNRKRCAVPLLPLVI